MLVLVPLPFTLGLTLTGLHGALISVSNFKDNYGLSSMLTISAVEWEHYQAHITLCQHHNGRMEGIVRSFYTRVVSKSLKFYNKQIALKQNFLLVQLHFLQIVPFLLK